MQRSKQTALLFLLGALLVGGALGFSADRVLLRDKLCPSWKSEGGGRARMFDELELDAAQRAAIDTILDERHRQIKSVMAPIRPQLDSIKEAAWVQMTQLMDERQRARFEEMRRETRAARAQDTTRSR